MGLAAWLPNLLPITPPGWAMARPEDSPAPDPDGRHDQGAEPWGLTAAQQRRHLQRCWDADCDLDPMILRARLLRHRGSLPQASCVEQELLPLF